MSDIVLERLINRSNELVLEMGEGLDLLNKTQHELLLVQRLLRENGEEQLESKSRSPEFCRRLRIATELMRRVNDEMQEQQAEMVGMTESIRSITQKKGEK